MTKRRTKHTVSVALAEVLAHANGQARVSEGGTAESTCSGCLAIAADIAGAQWDVGCVTSIDDDIDWDIG